MTTLAVIRESPELDGVSVSFHAGEMPAHHQESFADEAAARQSLRRRGYRAIRRPADADGDVLAIYQ